MIVVLFPLSRQLHYVLVVRVEKVSSTEVCLQYLDPRAQERFIRGLAAPGALRVVSPAMALQMLSGQADTIRKIMTTPATGVSSQDVSSPAGVKSIVQLNDRLH